MLDQVTRAVVHTESVVEVVAIRLEHDGEALAQSLVRMVN